MFRKTFLAAWLRILLLVVVLVFALYWMLLFDKGPPDAGRGVEKMDEALQSRLAQHVRHLAADIGERNIWRPKNLQAAAAYIESVWQAQGYEVHRQQYTARDVPVSNLEIEIRGKTEEEIVIVGAHYDTASGTPGANDNASGVAALLELSRFFSEKRLPRHLRFVAFVNEEPPFYYTRHMGSRVYAEKARQRGDNIVAMLSLETIGYYDDAPGSQSYPFPFSLFYPDTANFLGFVGNMSSRRLVREALHAFRRHSFFPAHGLAAPAMMTGVGWSDHWSFWQEGYAGIMVTDTALFRYNYYHTHEDTFEKLDYARLARVVKGLFGCIGTLAGDESTGRQEGQGDN